MELAREFDPKRIESLITEYNSGFNLHAMVLDPGRKGEQIVFIEGPPTMNGVPHAGHLRGRVIKDLWYRYSVLQGKRVIFNAGWDTQGLPVELQAQKELGAAGGKKKVVDSIGVEGLVAQCKKLVKRYSSKWMEVDRMLGMSLNQDGAYWTFQDIYIEREWQFLRKANEAGILENDYTVIAYCPSCQTSLSHAEVNQGYEEVEDPSLYYKVRLAGEDAYLIVWTTMPFTLVTDAMVGVNPQEEYHYVKVDEEVWVVGASRLDILMEEARIEEFTVLKTVSGAELEGRKYVHPLLGEIPKLKELSQKSNYHVTVAEDFVDIGAGSGLVHLSPANGEEDIGVADRRGVDVFNPIDDEVRFTADAGKYVGTFVRDADRIITDDLRWMGALVKVGKIKHKYPLCWRSRHRIVWLARRGWFYKLDRLGGLAIEAAEAVEYFFEQPRNRFLSIVRERHPWCISRERFWGCPIPAWRCRQCDHTSWFYTRAEIVAAAAKLPDGSNFELHRPWIDRVKVRCSNCSSTETAREPYVLDTWHNSGAAPYSSLNDAAYSKHIPAPFLTEGIDQTRGWAYTLLVENVILRGTPTSPYRAFLFQGHVLDSNGGKMSKSMGNVIDAHEMLLKYPADAVRFYFIWKSSPIEPLSFSTEEMMSRPYQVLSRLYHMHLYFKQNSEYDGFDPAYGTDAAAKDGLLAPPDVWLLSKLQKLIRKVSESNKSCRFHESARAIEEFVIGALSQTYIPATKGKLWSDGKVGRGRRVAIYAVLRQALRTLDVLIHPICPYTSEYLRLSTFGGGSSMLMEKWPVAEASLEDDRMEEVFDLMADVLSVAAAARMKGRLKRRWPIAEAHVCVAPGQKAKLEQLSELLTAQLNVQKCKIEELEKADGLGMFLRLSELGMPVHPVVQLDRKRIGPKVGRNMAALVAVFAQTDPKKIVAELGGSGFCTFDLVKSRIELGVEDFVVCFEASDGYAVASRGKCIVFISTTRNEEMVARGLVKDLARRLQELRKERGYDPTAVLGVASVLGLEANQLKAVEQLAEELKFLVRVKRISFNEVCSNYKSTDMDGNNIRIAVE